MADWPDDVDDDVYEQLDAQNTLDALGPEDPLDEGYSPPERPRGVTDWGVTAREQEEGESLDARLAREEPDIRLDDDSWDGIGDTIGTDGEPYDDEVGSDRAGRLVAQDEGDVVDTDEELVASDIGVDGAAASAEEAAVHVVDDTNRNS